MLQNIVKFHDSFLLEQSVLVFYLLQNSHIHSYNKLWIMDVSVSEIVLHSFILVIILHFNHNYLQLLALALMKCAERQAKQV